MRFAERVVAEVRVIVVPHLAGVGEHELIGEIGVDRIRGADRNAQMQGTAEEIDGVDRPVVIGLERAHAASQVGVLLRGGNDRQQQRCRKRREDNLRESGHDGSVQRARRAA
jgi:hypothetical protein